MTTRTRGKESNDDKLFAPKWHPVFKNAVDDLCHLLSRGYANNSASQLVGSRYKLNKRQREALSRICCSQEQIEKRKAKQILPIHLKNKTIEIDGFNILILLESALSGAYIFKGRDGLYRDLSGVHSTYKRVAATDEAIEMVSHYLISKNVEQVTWYLDQPISNSGRLKTRLYEHSSKHQLDWQVELVFSPDKVLAKSKNVVVSSDGWILDQCEEWFNLNEALLSSNNSINLLEY